MEIINLGSLNIDRVFRVDKIARPGETINSQTAEIFAGGKGANQSVALARAGARVWHVGKVGHDGRWLLDQLRDEGVETRWVRVANTATGQAMIQVADDGQNAIVLVAGANHEVSVAEVDEALATFEPSSAWLLTQNETSCVPEAMRRAAARQLRVAFNPAPFDSRVMTYPLELVDLLCVNESEGAAMTGQCEPDAIVDALAERLPRCEIMLTLGSAGVMLRNPTERICLPAARVKALDTTAAGDTFLGYYMAARAAGQDTAAGLASASAAAALCVTRRGAIASIPRCDEVRQFAKDMADSND